MFGPLCIELQQFRGAPQAFHRGLHRFSGGLQAFRGELHPIFIGEPQSYSCAFLKLNQYP